MWHEINLDDPEIIMNERRTGWKSGTAWEE